MGLLKKLGNDVLMVFDGSRIVIFLLPLKNMHSCFFYSLALTSPILDNSQSSAPLLSSRRQRGRPSVIDHHSLRGMYSIYALIERDLQSGLPVTADLDKMLSSCLPDKQKTAICFEAVVEHEA